MTKILAKLSIIAGAALLLGSATSAQAQCSSGSCSTGYSGQYYAPQQYYTPQSSCGQAQFYRQPVVQRAHPANCGCSTCRSTRAASSRRYNTSRSYRAVRPRVVVNPYRSYARPVRGSSTCRH